MQISGILFAMKRLYFVVILSIMGCVQQGHESNPVPIPVMASMPLEDNRPQVCQCSPNYVEDGCPLEGDADSDGDCVCNLVDNCWAVPNCDRLDNDGDGFGNACDILPNLPDPEATIAALDTRLDALEGAGTPAAIAALQYDIAALSAALAEIRTKYPAHYHGLLGLNGDPVGNSGDLNYDLPNDP